MEALPDFISSVEFLVGGILFTLALGYLLLGITRVPHIDADAAGVPGQSSPVLLIAFIFICLTYALGVVAESAARAIFEVVLVRLTVRKAEFLKTRTTSARDGKLRTRLTEFLLGDDEDHRRYTVEDRDAARSVRECQRHAS